MKQSRILFILALMCSTTSASILVEQPAAYAQDDEQEEAPYQIGVLDVSKKTSLSKKPKAKIVDLLARANGVSVDVDTFAVAAEDVGLDITELRSSDGREANKDKVAKTLKRAKLDVLLIIDVYKKGKSLQVLMLGGDGEEIYESKNTLRKKSTLKEEQAKGILKDAFTNAVPAIQAQREAEVEREAEEAQRQKEEEEAARKAAASKGDSKDDDDDDTFDDEKPSSGEGPLDGGITLGIGPFFGLRGLVFQTGNIEIENANPLVGGGTKLLAFKSLGGGKMHVGLDADLAWAPFGSKSTDATGQEVSLSGNYVRGGGVLKFAYALADMFALGLHAGADVFSFTLDPNDLYTGHRYIWARAGLDILLIPTPDFHLGLHASALPVLSVVTADGAYGEAQSTVGLEAGATLGVDLSDMFGVLVDYRYTSVNVDYLTAQDTTNTSADGMHSGMLMLSISF